MVVYYVTLQVPLTLEGVEILHTLKKAIQTLGIKLVGRLIQHEGEATVR